MIARTLPLAVAMLLPGMIAVNAAAAQVPDISGVYRSGRAETPCGRGANFGRNAQCPVNAAGLAAYAGATPETDPGLECVARPMEIIQTDNKIILHYEYFDVWREVHLDRDTAPPETPHTLAGFSVGHWEGDTLVVETSHLVENIHTIPTSDQTTTLERYRWNDDRSLLLLDVEITDPVYYDGPFRLRTAEFMPNPEDYIAQFVCAPQTELFYGEINALFEEK